jgi:hypothetical protein
MPLHRDIHWIGRQWAVTGHGMQLIDQKQKGLFDIEVSRLWDEAVIEGLRAQQWVNIADFDRGLDVARKRYTDISRPVSPLPESMTVRPAQPLQVMKPSPQEPETIESEKSAPRKFQMQFLINAKFIRPWRVRMKK